MQVNHPIASAPPPGTPLPAPDLSDMDRIHRLVASGSLASAMAKLARRGN